MNNRFLLALVLTAIVIVVTPMLFPGSLKRSPVVTADSLSHVPDSVTTQRVPPTPSPVVAQAASIDSSKQSATRHADTTTVHAIGSSYTLSNVGATLSSVTLNNYPSHRKVGNSGQVQLVGRGQVLASYRLALGKDTVNLDTVVFQHTTEPAAQRVTYVGSVTGHDIELTYAFPTDTTTTYLIHATAKVSNVPSGARLVITLPRTLLPMKQIRSMI